MLLPSPAIIVSTSPKSNSVLSNSTGWPSVLKVSFALSPKIMSLSLPVVTSSIPEPAIIILSPSPATTISLPACDGEVLTASTNTPASVKINSALSAAIISAPKPVSISSLPRPAIIILLPSLAAIKSRSP